MNAKHITWRKYLTLEGNPFPKATEQDISALEGKLGRTLPEDYKNALKAYQGMVARPPIVPLGDGGTPLGCLFHAFLQGEKMSYAVSVKTKRLEAEGYRNYVAISGTGNSFFCLNYNATKENPPIVFIDGDYEPSDPRGVIPIAKSFTELLDMLEEGE